jgi:hypothetical protein
MTDTNLLERFEAQSLPQDQWTHRTHVRVAFLYLSRYKFEDALARIRAGIQALNAVHGVVEGPTSGYNETTTHAFLHLIAATMRAYGTTHPAADSESFCNQHPHLLAKEVLRLFYSPARRLDPRTKTQFLAPDLAPLPTIGHE